MTHLALPAGLHRFAGLLAVAGLLAALALTLQPAAGQSTPIELAIGDRQADGSFEITFGGGTLDQLAQTGDALSVIGIAPVLGIANDNDDYTATATEIAQSRPDITTYDPNTDGQKAIPAVTVFVPHPKEAYAASGDLVEQTFTVSVALPSGGPVTATKMVPPPPERPSISVVGALRQDADGILRPGQTTELTIGLQVAVAYGANEATNAKVGLYSHTEFGGITESDETLRLAADSYLEISGPAAFADGTNLLRAGADGALQLKCEDTARIDRTRETGGTCYFVHDHDGDDLDADGDQDDNPGMAATPPIVPTITVASDASSDVTVFARIIATDTPEADGGDANTDPDPIWVALENDDDAVGPVFNPMPGTLYRVGGETGTSTYFGSYEIPVGTVEQVDSVTLTAATGEGATGTTVGTGSPVRLLLGILNADGRPSDVSGISSVTVTTTSGTVEVGTTFGTPTNLCAASSTCNLPIRGSAAGNQDLTKAATARPGLVGAIPIILKGVTRAGTATVSATVVATAGSSQPIYRADPISATFSGGADRLVLSATGTPRLLNIADGVANSGTEGGMSVAANLDQISFGVTATDSRGVATTTPAAIVQRVTGPDGSVVSSGITIAGNEDCGKGNKADETPRVAANCAFTVSVTAGDTTPLTPGIYTLSLSATGVAAGEAEFGVAGAPASVEISTDMPDDIRVGGSFEATIAVRDAAGELVADGTPVEVEVRRRTDRNAAVLLVSPSPGSDGKGMTKTADGTAKATFTVIAREISTINASARSGDVSDIEVVDTSAASAAITADPAEGLSSLTANGFTTWRGVGSLTASALLADLDDIASVQLWNGKRWVRYAVIDGQQVPGSLDFVIEDSDNLWLGG